MPKVAVFDIKGSQVGEMELSEAIFGASINAPAMHAMIVAHEANGRQGTKSTLTRHEVAGGGKKPWRQKGTGRARQGATRAPQWRHGGIVFAPKPRLFKKAVNKKIRRVAMFSALSSKVAESQFIVLDALQLPAAKTKEMAAMLKALKVDSKALIVTNEVNDEAIRAARNIPGVDTTVVNTLCVYDLMAHDACIMTKDAVAHIEEVYAL